MHTDTPTIPAADQAIIEAIISQLTTLEDTVANAADPAAHTAAITDLKEKLVTINNRLNQLSNQ